MALVIQLVTGLPVLLFVADAGLYVAFGLAGAFALLLRLLFVRLQHLRAGRSRSDTWLVYRLTLCRAPRALGALLLIAFFINLFGGWKRLIPEVRPFYLDPYLERWESIVHGGTAPWEWVVLNQPILTRALDTLYFYGLAGFALATAWVVWSTHPLRNRLLVSLVLFWVGLGAVLATLLSSAGPAFLAESFTVQREYLRGLEVKSAMAQTLMWSLHLGRVDHPYAAISAMPSLHVGTPALFLLAARERYPVVFWPGVAFLGLTILATVHLGWHYALDGYVALVLAWLYWHLPTRRPYGGFGKREKPSGSTDRTLRPQSGRLGDTPPSP